MEKRLLQFAVAVAGLVPVSAGMAGGLKGTLLLGDVGDAALDSHVRFLSGLLLAIGVAFWSTIPDIERRSERFGFLTLLIVIGGFFRAVGLLMNGSPGPVMLAALIMELAVTPALYLWQLRVARAALMDAPPLAR